MPKASLHDELEALHFKADQLVTSHSYLRDHYLGWGQRLNLYTLIASAILLFFTLASEDFILRTLGLGPDGYKWAMASTAFFTFCLSLIDLGWNPTAKSKAHDQAVGHYLRMSYEVRNLNSLSHVQAERVRWIQEEFLDAADLPRIPEADAIRFKQRHLLKLAMAQALKRNPHQALWWLRVKLWWDPTLAEAPPLKPKRKR
jgi:hypothetical protein